MTPCSFDQFIADQVPQFDELILEQSKPCSGWEVWNELDPLLEAMETAMRDDLIRKIMAGQHPIKSLSELSNLEELKRRLDILGPPCDP